MGIRLCPSILSADFANLERDIAAVANADWLHVDVMDGHFVPNMTLGLPIFERIAQVSPLPVDAHLMIDNPGHWAVRYAEAGASSVTFHVEACENPIALARAIRQTGARAAVALKPATDVRSVIDDLAEFDMVLVMTVEPGFGGQSLIPETLEKFRVLREAASARGVDVWLQADGGVSVDTIGAVVEAGADTLVAGSAVYDADDPAAVVEALRVRAEGAHHH